MKMMMYKVKQEQKIHTTRSFRDAVNNKQRETVSEKTRNNSVTWSGTSFSKALDKKKFEHDTKVKLKVVKAYCIQKEGKYPMKNFHDVVPNELKKEPSDVVVFQTGSIEITNFDVRKAMMETLRIMR